MRDTGLQLLLWADRQPGAQGPVPSGPPLRPPGNGHSALSRDPPRDPLLERLIRLGLPPFPRFETHRNQQVMLSWIPGRRLRVHEGYRHAPDDVLAAIVRFVTPGTRRATRLGARRVFLGFPAEAHAPGPSRAPRARRIGPKEAGIEARLQSLHSELNALHFEGALAPIPIRLSGRMRSRLGELRMDRGTGRRLAIGISYRHLRRDGWAGVRETLLHEMVHQWQAETDRPVDHGVEFRRKARQLGIEPTAVSRQPSDITLTAEG